MHYTSRSYIEDYQDCGRSRFNLQFLMGTGVVAARKSVPLITGTAIHVGVGNLLEAVRDGKIPDCEGAVKLAVDQYVKEVGEAGFSGKDFDNDRQQRFTYDEQKALTEALVRAWYLRELPRIQERYHVLNVEREIPPILLVNDIWMQSRIDAELQERETNQYVNYSLKSCKQWDERMENSYKSDLQGITEIWCAERDAERVFREFFELARDCEKLDKLAYVPTKNLETIAKWADKQANGAKKRIGAIRFCYLVKGKQYKNEGVLDALKVTYNPLIRGYRSVTPGGIDYAHSWTFPNQQNKSGKSTLGKGWEPFNVWESDIGIKRWIEWLATGSVQPECGDVVKQQVVTPVEYFRSENEIAEGMRECVEQESRVFNAIDRLNSMKVQTFAEALNSQTSVKIIDSVFPHNRKHCFFRFGDRCEYYDLCWKGEVAADPIGSELYQIRVPHHEAERNANV